MATLDSRGAVQVFEKQFAIDPESILVGKSVPADFDRWRDEVVHRADEVSASTRNRLRSGDRFEVLLAESYRTVTTETALGILAAFDSR